MTTGRINQVAIVRRRRVGDRPNSVRQTIGGLPPAVPTRRVVVGNTDRRGACPLARRSLSFVRQFLLRRTTACPRSCRSSSSRSSSSSSRSSRPIRAGPPPPPPPPPRPPPPPPRPRASASFDGCFRAPLGSSLRGRDGQDRRIRNVVRTVRIDRSGPRRAHEVVRSTDRLPRSAGDRPVSAHVPASLPATIWVRLTTWRPFVCHSGVRWFNVPQPDRSKNPLMRSRVFRSVSTCPLIYSLNDCSPKGVERRPGTPAGGF